MSTHNIVRDTELKSDELPALRTHVKTENNLTAGASLAASACRSPNSGGVGGSMLVDPDTYGKVSITIPI